MTGVATRVARFAVFALLLPLLCLPGFGAFFALGPFLTAACFGLLGLAVLAAAVVWIHRRT